MQDYLLSPRSITNAREENQDAFGHYDTAYGSLFVVCDGFGGLTRGQIASERATEAFADFIDHAASTGMSALEAMQYATSSVNRMLLDLGLNYPDYAGLGTTVVLALDTPEGLRIGHVGDSRAYLYGAHGLLPLTKDHSAVGELLFHNEITWDEALQHPQAGVLSRALGAAESVEMELYPRPIQPEPGHGLLLCSDGLCGFVPDAVIESIIASCEDQREVADRLVEEAVGAGSDDNVTVLYIARPAASADITPQPQPEPVEPVPAPSPEQVPPPPVNPASMWSADEPGGDRPERQRFASVEPAPLPRRRHQPELREEPSRRFPLWGYLLILMVLAGLTVFHLSTLVSIEPYEPVAIEEDQAEEMTDIDHADDYPWTGGECQKSMVEQAKSVLGEFEAELRHAASISDQEEIEKGKIYRDMAFKELDFPIDTDPVLTAYVNKVGTSLLKDLERPAIPYHFYVVDHDEANAFALPGGHIFVFSGLLNRFVHNEAQLAFVLGHEISHVDRRHCLALFRVIENLPGQEMGLGGVVRYVINFPFSTGHEEEADRYGLKRVLNHGYSPFQAALFLEAWHKADNPVMIQPANEGIFGFLLQEAEDLFRTHPNRAYRACELKNLTVHLLDQGADRRFYVGTRNYDARVPMSEERY